jgi:type IV pilus assembly protein PilW
MIKRNAGFTLVELMIAVAVGMIVLGAVYAVFNTQNKILGDQEQIAELHQNTRVALDMMVREISMAGYNQTTNPAVTAAPRCTDILVATAAAALTTPNCAGIVIAGTDTITFSMDVTDTDDNSPQTPDGLVDGPNEYITYRCYTSAGIRALGRKSKDSVPIQPVVEYVESLNFTYDSASLENIRKVKITICTRTSKPDLTYTNPIYGDHYRRYCLSSFAYPRNMALNTASTSATTLRLTTIQVSRWIGAIITPIISRIEEIHEIRS